jgi:hypothetical protein
MRSLLFAIASVTAAQGQKPLDVKAQWAEFKSQHGPTFADAEEEAFRFSVFERNLAEAVEVGQRNPRRILV